MKKTAYELAFSRWFSDYDAERRRQKKRPGARLKDFPDPPASPDDVAQVLNQVGRARALDVLQCHRTTLDRWMSGDSVIPRPAWLLLSLLAEGRLPGMSADWREWRFDGDRLCHVGGRFSVSARELSGWPYVMAQLEVLKQRVAALEKENARLCRLGHFGSANDPLMAVSGA